MAKKTDVIVHGQGSIYLPAPPPGIDETTRANLLNNSDSNTIPKFYIQHGCMK